MEYFDQQLAGALKRAGVIVGSWLFANAPNQSQPGTAFEDPDDSDDEVPLGVLLGGPSEILDFAFVDPDFDGDLLQAPGVALWGDGGLTLATLEELLGHASAACKQLLNDRQAAHAVWLDERPALRVLLRYRSSVQLHIVKLFVCHYGRQPRSERKGTGLITSVTQINEVAWEHAGHAYIDASACCEQGAFTERRKRNADGTVVSTRTRHSAKLKWRNVEDVGGMWRRWPSQHQYKFVTAVALSRLVPLHMLFVLNENSALEAKCPLPLGHVTGGCKVAWLQHANKPADLPAVLVSGDPGFVIGLR